MRSSPVHVPARSPEKGPDKGMGPGDDDLEQALFIARRIPVKVFVMHLEGTRDVARRRVARIAELAEPLGVTVAVDASDLSRPGSALHFVEEETDASVGICLDFYLIAQMVFTGALASLFSVGLGTVFVGLWFVLPRVRRLQALLAGGHD